MTDDVAGGTEWVDNDRVVSRLLPDVAGRQPSDGTQDITPLSPEEWREAILSTVQRKN